MILTPGTAPNAALATELFAYCRQHLAPYKMPRILEFVPELPKTISGKIRRVNCGRSRGAKGIFCMRRHRVNQLARAARWSGRTAEKAVGPDRPSIATLPKLRRNTAG